VLPDDPNVFRLTRDSVPETASLGLLLFSEFTIRSLAPPSGGCCHHDVEELRSVRPRCINGGAHVTAHPRKPFFIRDPVHGYLQIAPHERIVVDHPITQRLRRVNQTGVADLIYPEARTSRFAHSLGTMHLASTLFVRCLENAERDVLDKVLDTLASRIQGSEFRELKELDALLFAREWDGGLAAQRAPLFLSRNREDTLWAHRVLVYGEAGLRLAALFHDLGHLPYSHDFEIALEEHLKTQPRGTRKDFRSLIQSSFAPHEVLGHRLAHMVFRHCVNRQAASPIVQAVYRLAVDILDAHKPQADESRATVLGWLHSLIDGELDADRLDYLLRDARALGFVFASYDIERLLSTVSVVCENDRGYETIVDERGLTALESYFISRYRSHLNLARHHKVSQVAAAFRYASQLSLETSDGAEILRLIRQILLGESLDAPSSEEALSMFSEFDDANWRRVIADTPTRDSLHSACKDVILRRAPTLRSLWKRKGDLSSGLRKELGRRFSGTLRIGSSARLRSAHDELRDRQMLVASHTFRSYRIDPSRPRKGSPTSRFRVRTNSGLEPLTALSPLVRSLAKAIDEELPLHVFAMTEFQDQEAQRQIALDCLMGKVDE